MVDSKKTILSYIGDESDPKKIAARCGVCRACDLWSNRYLIGGSGNPNADYFFIVSQRDTTAEVNSLFGTYTWQLFKQTLDMCNIELASIWVTPAIACHPKDRKKETQDKHVNACKRRVIREIHLVNPRLIIALGTKAIKAAFAIPGKKPKLEAHEGLILPTKITGKFGDYDAPVLILQDPVLLLRYPDTTPWGNINIFKSSMYRAVQMVNEMKELAPDN